MPAAPTGAPFACRLATPADAPQLRRLVAAAITELQRPFLAPDQVAASRRIMGLDSLLIADRSYFVVEAADGRAAGCGGWSRRSALVGGDELQGRDLRPLDPAVDAARIRAMYTHPSFARQGVGRMLLACCEAAAAAAGFRRVELMATLAGRELFRRCGYRDVEAVEEVRDGVAIPLVRMGKELPR